jgi:hydrogenase expression/formation protein HypC
MCLAFPARVVEIAPNQRAVVDLEGVRRDISTALLDDVHPGDYVILHVGYALSLLDREEAERTIEELRSFSIAGSSIASNSADETTS